MKYRRLGKTNLEVSLVSFGSGGPSKLGQNTGLTPQEQDHLIKSVLNLGINLIDSSEVYGDSETILGRSLTDVDRESYCMVSRD